MSSSSLAAPRTGEEERAELASIALLVAEEAALLVSAEHAPENNFDSFIAVKRIAQAVRRCGSAALDLCMVADGTYDGYWERSLNGWDTVAASAIVLAAGGRITALDGGAPNYHIGHLAASNGLLHEALLGILNGER